jgi:putative membrane protein
MKSNIFFLAVFALCMSACHNKNNTDTSTATSMDSSSKMTGDSSTAAKDTTGGSSMQSMADDSSFLTKANDIGMFEIKIGQLAQSNSQNANVKEMANMMIQDHTAFGKKVMDQAQKENITLPAALCDKSQKEYDKLNKLNGQAFDKEYANVNVKGHKEAIELFQKTASDSSASPSVQQLASSALPTLQKHLKHSEMLKSQLKMAS